jgi:predicted 3-demethylubiquinone-9 3-methyltransferase (glyoxalase superfamily)
MKSITTFLMFCADQHGKAEQAMGFYTSLFKESRIVRIDRYGAGEQGPEGTVKVAAFTLNGKEFMAIDGAGPHAFTFTPAISLFVECESVEEIERVYRSLSDGGMALMELGAYGFSKRFGWVQDKFGVSWQLNLA